MEIKWMCRASVTCLRWSRRVADAPDGGAPRGPAEILRFGEREKGEKKKKIGKRMKRKGRM